MLQNHNVMWTVQPSLSSVVVILCRWITRRHSKDQVWWIWRNAKGLDGRRCKRLHQGDFYPTTCYYASHKDRRGMIKAGIIGGAGYTAGELIRLTSIIPRLKSYLSTVPVTWKQNYWCTRGLYGSVTWLYRRTSVGGRHRCTVLLYSPWGYRNLWKP